MSLGSGRGYVKETDPKVSTKNLQRIFNISFLHYLTDQKGRIAGKSKKEDEKV